jgi:two-component system, OmpR family, phosphate regulon response regulator PhoB
MHRRNTQGFSNRLGRLHNSADAARTALDADKLRSLCNFRMPEMGGPEFIRQFRTIPNRRAVPCVMLTGIAEPSIRQEAMKLGVVDFLNRPTSVDRLMAHVAKAIGNT